MLEIKISLVLYTNISIISSQKKKTCMQNFAPS